MLIRHALPDSDAEACASIYAPFVRDSAVSFEERVATPDELAMRIQQTSKRYPWLVAEHDRRVVGFAYAGPHRERAAYRWAVDVSVYVDGHNRRRGVATTLYRALLALLERQGIQVACVGITLPNEASVAFHESLGFRLVGIYRRIGWKAGSWRDVGWWSMELRRPDDEPPSEPGPPVQLPGQ